MCQWHGLQHEGRADALDVGQADFDCGERLACVRLGMAAELQRGRRGVPHRWRKVFRAVEHTVHWGWVHQDDSGIVAIGVDEIYGYLTSVYQIDPHSNRLLWVGEKCGAKTLLRFFR